MPRDSAGNYSLVAGNPVQSGEVVSSSWANNTLDDVAVALSDSLDRNGRGGMLAPFRFADGTNLLPGASWTNETTTGLYRFDGGDLRVAVLTQDVMRWQTSGAQVWDSKRNQWVGLLDAGGATTIDINQAGHGFAVLDCVQFEGTWVKALADDDSTLALGVVVEVIDTDNFTYAMSGRFEVANGLVSDSWYYLSDTVAGELTPTEPKISQPIVYVESNSHISVYPYRPFEADPYADLPTVGTNDQTLRWNDTLPGWEANSNLLVQADGLISAGNTGGLVVGADTPVNTLVTTSAGNVGIGTTTPDTLLEVAAQNLTEFEGGIKLGEGTVEGDAYIGFTQASPNDYIWYNSPWVGFTGNPDVSIATLKLNSPGVVAFTGVNANERMRIASDGKVGIGTAAPASLLTVSDSSAIASGEARDMLLLTKDNASNSNAGPAIQFLPAFDSAARIVGRRDGSAVATMLTFETSALNDGTSVEAMRITSTGNVLVGTTSTTSPSRLLEVLGDGDTCARIRSSGVDAYLSLYGTTTSEDAVRIGAVGQQMVFDVFNAERMRIDTSGRLLVGKTVQTAGGQLEVAGDGGLWYR